MKEEKKKKGEVDKIRRTYNKFRKIYLVPRPFPLSPGAVIKSMRSVEKLFKGRDVALPATPLI